MGGGEERRGKVEEGKSESSPPNSETDENQTQFVEQLNLVGFLSRPAH